MKPRVALFLSRNTPLARWDRLGVLARETALYRHLGGQVAYSLVTSGGAGEQAYAARLGELQILANRWGLSANVYSLLAPWLHRAALRQVDLFKTNQLDGAWTAVFAARLHHKPLIVRAGYLWAENFARERGSGAKTRLISALQTWTLRTATHLVVTTAAMKAHYVAQYRLPSARITVIPNYVDTQQFAPDPFVQKENGRLVFVGRLNAVKNLDLLMTALSGVPGTHLLLIGQGEEQPRLAELAQRLGVAVTFAGQLPHDQLPAALNRAALFVLPSRFEGHPKALIEAMACGTAVLGADVEGIRDVIQHGETGWLCPPTVAGLRQAIQTLITDVELRQRLGENGRQFAVENYSLDQIAQKEFALYQQILNEHANLPPS